MSDVKLDGEYVIVEGAFLKSKTLDIMLDHPSRRSNNQGERRALVHDLSDGLTINYDKDYPGGVTIRGDLKTDGVTVRGDLKADGGATIRGDLKTDGVTVRGDLKADGGATIRGDLKTDGGATIHGDLKAGVIIGARVVIDSSSKVLIRTEDGLRIGGLTDWVPDPPPAFIGPNGTHQPDKPKVTIYTSDLDDAETWVSDSADGIKETSRAVEVEGDILISWAEYFTGIVVHPVTNDGAHHPLPGAMPAEDKKEVFLALHRVSVRGMWQRLQELEARVKELENSG